MGVGHSVTSVANCKGSFFAGEGKGRSCCEVVRYVSYKVVTDYVHIHS